jgi:hypothetical protein
MELLEPPPAPRASRPVHPASSFQATAGYGTEEEWTVTQVAQFISDFGALTRTPPALPATKAERQPGDAGAGRYLLRSGNATGQVDLGTGVWTPATYLSWAQTHLKPGTETLTPAADEECVKALLTPGWKVLLGEDQRISEALRQNPASARAHTQAAVLVGTLALNEYAGHFEDARLYLNRVTAHLAAAQALGQSVDEPIFRLAQAIRLTLTGEQSTALPLIDALRTETGINRAYQEWALLLRLRVTCDWREGRESAAAGSPALRQEYFRALVRATAVTKGLEFWAEIGNPAGAEMPRIANEEADMTMGQRHQITRGMYEWEMAEIRGLAVYYGFGKAKDKEDVSWLQAYLDTPEGSPVTLSEDGKSLKVGVVSRNLVAGLQQRRLMYALGSRHAYYHDSWGVRDQAAQLKAWVAGDLPPLRYRPFLLRVMIRDAGEGAALTPACNEVIARQPQMVTPWLWTYYGEGWTHGNRVVAQSPDFHGWFHPEVPRGTAYRTGLRNYEIGVGDENDFTWLKTLYDRAPNDYDLAKHNARLENGGSLKDVKPSVLKKWYGPLLDYYLPAMSNYAYSFAADPLQYEAASLKMAPLNTNVYLGMGRHFEKEKLQDKAMKYFLLYYENTDDEVGKSSLATTLVPHFYQKGDRKTAREIAEHGAEVYSYDGLRAAVWYYEQEKEWEPAMRTAKALDARYNGDDPKEECALLVRCVDNDRATAEKMGFQKVFAYYFPNGMRKVTLKDFTAPPERGARFRGTNEKTALYNLESTDVIVALDGYQVEGELQYNLVWEHTSGGGPELTLIVWDGTTFTERKGSPPGRRFGLYLADYKAIQ